MVQTSGTGGGSTGIGMMDEQTHGSQLDRWKDRETYLEKRMVSVDKSQVCIDVLPEHLGSVM
jgi:hypothetical protein